MSIPTFKELVNSDISSTFMNASEFAELHTVDGKSMKVIIDNNEHIEREKRVAQKQVMDGLYVKQVLIYISSEDYGPLPAQGKQLILDQKRYRVADAIDEDGLYSITLEANKS
jgi:hypothetical protein